MHCIRCKEGFVVWTFVDSPDERGPLRALRCVSCGEIVDLSILENRSENGKTGKQNVLGKTIPLETILERRMVLKLGETADLLGISQTKMHELLTQTDIPRMMLGRSIVIPTQALMKWIMAKTKGGKEE